MEIDISKRREKERKICDKIHKEMEMIKKSNLLLVDRDNMDDVIVTIKRRGKKGRWTSAKSIKLNDFLNEIKPIISVPEEPSMFSKILKTKKYMTYFEKKTLNYAKKLYEMNIRLVLSHLVGGKK